MKPMIRDIIKKLLLDKKELTLQEKNDLLLYFELQEPGSETIVTERQDNLSHYVIEDLTSQITGSNNSFELSQVAIQKVYLSCNLEQLPSSITMYTNMKGFYLSFVPTTRDKVVVGYFTK